MKKYIIILIALVCSLQSYSQNICENECDATERIVLTTGVDNNGNLLPLGSIDPNWMLMNIAPLSENCANASNLTAMMNPPNAYTVNWDDNCSSCWINQTGSVTIGPINQSSFNCNSFINSSNERQPFIFDRPFCICEESEVRINVSFRADDGLELSLIDEYGTTLASSSAVTYTATQNWIRSINLSPGNYRIRAKLINTHSGVTGFSVLGDLRANEKVITTNNNASCCEDYAISIQKIIDKDCSGTYNDGDSLGNNSWSFQIKDASNTIVRTISTDDFGVATATGLSQGIYTITELNINGYYPYENNLTVELSNIDKIKFINFFNCQGETPIDSLNFNCCETPLGIANVPNTPSPLPIRQVTEDEATFSVASETFQIHENQPIPITEIRVSVIDLIYKYNYESCGDCVNNPALWGSLMSQSVIGEKGLYPTAQDYTTSNMISANQNVRELVWTNPDGALLKPGDKFDVNYILPPASDIPCCVTEVQVCTQISWKDANCCYNDIKTCSTIKLESEQTPDPGPSSTCECDEQFPIVNIRDNNSVGFGSIQAPNSVSCGSFTNLDLYKRHNRRQKVLYTFDHPGDGNCKPSSCNSIEFWKITDEKGRLIKQGTGNINQFQFPSTGTYNIEFTPSCGGNDCKPCEFKVNVRR